MVSAAKEQKTESKGTVAYLAGKLKELLLYSL